MSRTRATRHPEDPDVVHTDEDRAAQIEALRQAYLAGVLDLSIPEDGPGFDRLLGDLFGGDAAPSTPRAKGRRPAR
jgi:hypothetical protein